MVIIKEIKWISKDALEAEIIVSDGENDLLCFSHPFKMNEGDQLIDPIYAFEASKIQKLDALSFKIKKLKGSFDYSIQGQLMNKELGIVKLGNILIDIGNDFIPSDLKNNDYISFNCERFDIY
ncbi:hypothetical protein [Spongiimicrobium salis]|uniref:hypothetical protein n=1 Tax=Spongiimicrobium salis TaxID=1667022 RepID=UPI00374D725C